MILIGISGKMACGKTTASTFLAELLERKGMACRILPFAQPLKEEASALYGFPLEWTRTGKDRDVNIPENAPADPGWGGRATVRRILQYYGTDVCRAREPGIWVRKFLEKAGTLGAGCVICDDVRFRDEAMLFREKGFCFRLESYPGYRPKSFHESETALDDWDGFHAVFRPKYGESHLRDVAGRMLAIVRPDLDFRPKGIRP